MKLILDTEKKTIVLTEAVNMKDLHKELISIFPNNEWENYKITPYTIISNTIPDIGYVRDWINLPVNPYPLYSYPLCT